MTSNEKEEIKACVFYGTMAAIFTSGAALTMDNTVIKAVGTAMVFWVLGFLGSLTVFAQMRVAADVQTDTKKESDE